MYIKQKNKLWYRKARFDIRKRKEEYLPLSLQNKLETKKRLINNLKI